MATLPQNPRVEANPASPTTRLRITFAKTDAMRFTGHLDLHQAWERVFRRAGLPIAYSHGFNPRPRIQLASALPLGFTSQAEILDVWLEAEMDAGEAERRLANALPPGLVVKEIEPVDLKDPALQTEVEAAQFTATFLEPIPDLDDRIEKLLAEESISRTRRNRDYDLRPLILRIEILPPDAEKHARITLLLRACEGATGRPEEVIEALGENVNCVRFERLCLIFRPVE